ncbi:MAG: hypothetical protein GIKADHBN_00075 [Phycisphaerales bacterium]|nr:hypothetical protein [Phycisphaerales bacterium]
MDLRCYAASALILAAVSSAHAQPADPPRKADPAPAAAAPQPCSVQSAEQLLEELEQADKGLKGMQAEILLHRSFVLEQDRQTRQGMLYFRQLEGSADRPATRQFHVRFDVQITGSRQERDKEQKFIFDGQWLAEINPGEKRFDRRQLVAPGENFDPLKVGEGPLPIPIGQKKEDILARFDVELVDAADGLTDENARQQQAWRKFVAGTCQLRLVPKADAEDVDFTEIRLWYRKDAADSGAGRWLPRMSRTVNHAGDVTIVQLVNVQFTDTIEDQYFDTAFPDLRGWDFSEVPLRRAPKLNAPGPEVIDGKAPAGEAPALPGPADQPPPASGSEPPAANPGAGPKSPS